VSGAVPVTFVSSHAHLGGEEGYLATLLEELGPDWIHEVVLLDEGPFVERLRAQGYPLHVLPTSRRAGIAVSAWRLRRHFARTRPQLVHANGIKAALVAALAGRAPLLWLKHDFSWDGKLARFIGRRSRLVVGVSGAVTETFEGSGVEAKVVHTGIRNIHADRGAGRRRLLEALGTPEPTAVAAIAARVDPTKGHDEVLSVLPEILERLPGFRLAIMGAEHAPHLEHASGLRRHVAEQGLREAVTFLGYRDDAVELISGCDAILIPSTVDERGRGREGFPLTALEAMAVGTPVIGYDHGGLPELVGDCGVLVPPGDRASLRDAILEVMRDESMRSRLARCGPERVATRFTLPRFVEEMKERYREAANRAAMPEGSDVGRG
jgi:glycosyltransferase involved in cell wall biosynthesis